MVARKINPASTRGEWRSTGSIPLVKHYRIDAPTSPYGFIINGVLRRIRPLSMNRRADNRILIVHSEHGLTAGFNVVFSQRDHLQCWRIGTFVGVGSNV
jgi:hypothetical protein